MKLKRIALIEPYKSKFRTPRLGLPILGTILVQQGYQVEIYRGKRTELPWKLILEADLIGISTTTATSIEGYHIADYLKNRSNIPIVMGGTHVTFMPEEALHYADYVIRGEGERSFPALVEAIRKDSLPEGIPGVSYWRNREMMHNEDNNDFVDVNTLPIPELSLIKNPIGMYPVMTSRGCPFHCVFCSVTPMFGHHGRFTENEKLLQEFTRYKNGTVFFCDDNFAINKARTKNLLQEMIDREVCPKLWYAQARADIADDDELLELMRLSNASELSIGLESVNAETLKVFNKKQSVKDVRECVRRVKAHNIDVLGVFTLGSDVDTKETIRETVEFAIETVDVAFFTTLTPLPGTGLYEQMEAEGRLLTRNWELYDCFHVVFQPNKMSPAELQEEAVRARERFFAKTINRY